MAATQLTVLVSGASGFIGSELVRQLEADGHTVRTLVRRAPESDSEVRWSPSEGTLDASALDDVDAVVNLSGASTGRLPWTKAYKKEILESRVTATRTLAQAITASKRPPITFLNGSAVGYFGDRPGEILTEASAKGTGYFPGVVGAWEAEAQKVPAKTRVVTFRTGVVVGHGGAFTPLIPLTKAGLGSRFGSGRQVWPWISLHDEAAAIRHLLTSGLEGPINLAGPTPASADDVTRALAKKLRRWYLFRIPAWVIRALLGEAGQELLLTDEHISPEKLLADGFAFEHTTVQQAIDAL